MQKIMTFLRERKILVTLVLIIVIVVGVIIGKAKNGEPNWTTGTVDIGTVTQSISVSGTVDATKNAELSFPVGGVLESMSVKEGDNATKGMALATLAHNDLSAQYRNAYGAFIVAKADQSELLTGLRPEEREIAETKAKIAEEDLARTIREENDKVASAYRALLGTDLVARPKKKDNSDTPPTVSGAYTCDEGIYTLDVFNSSARSGYSYRLSGIEGGTYTAYTESPASMGACGLFIQFVDGMSYGNSLWEIRIPNKESSSYITNKNAYDLAVVTKENAIRAAEQALELAKETETLTTATPRSESITREGARVIQAEAQLAQINAQIEDHILRAPFDGTVTHIDLVSGETVGTEPVMTMVSEGYFELNALIPEIDITRIAIEQKAEIIFDARQEETLIATITYISPVAQEIAGVSYFETTLILDESVTWLRGGLNADINIIVEKHENVLRVPKRFLVENDGTHTILIPDGKESRPVPVTVLFEGNDGYAHIEGLSNGDTVIAP